MALVFGIFDHQERRPDVPLDQQYRERLALLAVADRLGFWGYHLAEHHQSPLCMAPSQSVFLAAAAQHTSRLHLGSLVYLLPFYHPVRLVEEIAMLDNLSEGRLQVGVGRGISPLEHRFWGHAPEEAGGRFEEALTVLVAGLSGDRLIHQGTYFAFADLPMEVRPKQRPYPPLWYAGNIETAARRGMHTIGSGGLRRLPDIITRYRALWQAHRDDPARLNPHVTDPLIGTARHLFVAESEAEAKAVGRRAWQAYHRNFPKRGHETPGPGGPSLGGDFDLARKVEAVVVGSPPTVRAYVEQYAAVAGANYFVGAFQWGDLTHEEALSSLTLFATRVMPAVAGGERV